MAHLISYTHNPKSEDAIASKNVYFCCLQKDFKYFGSEHGVACYNNSFYILMYNKGYNFQQMSNMILLDIDINVLICSHVVTRI